MLYIKNFYKQNFVTDSEIIHAIKRIPNSHLKGLEYIVYDPERFFQRSYANPKPINHAALGQYNQLPKKFITIYKISSKEDFFHVLYHEVGHHIFNHALDSKLKVQWVNDVYKNSLFFVSEYAKRNAQEDFCESYAAFYCNQKKLLKDQLKFTFIKKLCLK